MSDPERLQRLLGGPGLAWLVERVRHRMERGQPLTGRLVLQAPAPDQRAAVAHLLGNVPGTGQQLSVDLEAVDAVLRRSGASPGGLPAAVVALRGEVIDLTSAATDAKAAWEKAFSPLDGDPRAELAAWRMGLRSSGLVRRLAGSPHAAYELLAKAARVLAALPASGEPRGHLAARILGDAHALDDGRPLSTIVFGAARSLSGLPDGTGTHWRRSIWEAAGVLPDDLSSSVLALGFPGGDGCPLGRVLREWQMAGEPVSLTLRQVRSPGLSRALGVSGVAGPEDVFICENPVIVSMAADRWGQDCAPLVCVNGQPGVAVQLVLRALLDSGARLRYHGDFDWGGLRIANGMITRFGADPWRMDVASYQEAAVRGLGRELSGSPVEACWDTGLAPAMSSIGLGIDEEHVVDDLLQDLCALAHDGPSPLAPANGRDLARSEPGITTISTGAG